MPASRNKLSSVILHVDDNESIRYVRGRTLAKAGYHIIDAATGEEALRLAAAHQPDLVILDVSLPDIDGTEVCHRLKSGHDTSHIMVLQVSAAHTSAKDLVAGLEGGADSYLVEPIDQLELLATTKALLRLTDREKENRRLIEQLSRSERQLTEATSAADCGVWDWEILTGKLEWFGAHERLAGMLPGGFSGKIDVFSEILHPDDRIRVWHKLQGMMERAEEHYSDEYRFVHPDGSVHWMTARGRFFYDDTGQAVRMTGVVQDITNRKQTEEMLRLLNRALSASEAGVLVVDATATDLPIIFASAGFERLTGYRAAEVLGRNCRFLQGLETNRTQVEQIRATLEAGHPIRLVLRNYRKDGTAFWNDLSISPVHDAAGHLTHFVGIQNDVTALIDAQHALRESEERLRLALEGADMGTWDLDVRTGQAIWSRRHAQLHGYDEEGPHSFERWRDRVHPDDLSRILTAIDQAKRDQTSFIAEHRVRLSNNEGERWLSLYGRFTYDEAGQPARFSGVSIDITDRKQAADALRAAHDTPFGVYAVDSNFRLVQVSAGAQKVFENVRPLLGRDFTEVLRQIWPEPFASESIARFRHTLATGEPYRASSAEKRKDIEKVESYDWKIERVMMPDGHFGVVCHFYDLSERQRYEQQLASAKQQLEATLSGNEIGLWHWDLTDNRLVTDQNLKRLFGLDPSDDLPPEAYTRRIHADDFARNQAAIERVVQNDGFYEQQFRVMHSDGSIRWLHSRGKVQTGAQGGRSFVGVVLDITKRKEAEEQLRESEERLNLALLASSTGVWDWNLLSDEVTWTGHIHPIFGVTHFEGNREAFARQVHPEDADRLWTMVKRCIEEHLPFETEFRIIRPTGEVRWVNNFGKAEYDEYGTATRLLGTVSDITDRKMAEQELLQLQEKLEDRVRERTKELLAMQEQLMAATSQLSLIEQRERRKLARDLHDYLAQMLIVGQMKTGMLKKTFPPLQASTTLLQDLDKVFQEALTYTRTLIAELSPPSLQNFGLPAALQWLGKRFEKDGLRVEVRADSASIPLPEEQAVVVFQSVRELLFNVMKHAGVDRATVTVSLGDGNILRVAIADGGKGLSPEALQRSAEPGHLGLVSVRERFRAMRGRVEMVSLPGKGTTVTLELPLTGGEGGLCAVSKQ